MVKTGKPIGGGGGITAVATSAGMQGPANLRAACFAVARDLRTVLDRELAPFGLRTQQAAVLLRCCRITRPSGVATLAGESMADFPAKPSQLAAAVGTDTAGITGLIDHLAKRGLVVRRADPADRRAVLVEPTAEGRALAPRLRDVFRAVNEVLTADLSDEDEAAVLALLARLRLNLQSHLAQTADISPAPGRQRRPRR